MTTQKERLEQFKKVQQEGYELFNKKNTDYGDAFADFGVIGIIVRVSDKMRRFVSVSNNGISLVNDEALRDTLIDMHNYSAMAIMLMDEKKEKDQHVDEELDKIEDKKNEIQFSITEQELKGLESIRNYFGQNDLTQLEHFSYSFLDRLLKKLRNYETK